MANFATKENLALFKQLLDQTSPDIEVVEYQTTTPLTDAQVAKAQAGKLAILKGSYIGLKIHSADSAQVRFATNGHPLYAANSYFPNEYQQSYDILALTISTRMLSLVQTVNAKFVPANDNQIIQGEWIPNVAGKEIVRALNLRKTQDMITPNVYSASATYALGDVVIYQNQLYKCTTAIPVAEAWDATHWTLTNLVNYIRDTEAIGLEVVTLTGSSGTISDATLLARILANPQNIVLLNSDYCYGLQRNTSDSLIYGKYGITTTTASGTTIAINKTTGVWSWANSSYHDPDKQNALTTSSVADATLSTVIGFDASGNVKKATMPDVSGKQDIIDSSHKLSADLVDDTSTTNKFVTASDKSAWSGKQDALVNGVNIKSVNGISLLGPGDVDTNANLAEEYDATATYQVGDVVIYQHGLYQCVSEIAAAEAWDATHWTRTTVYNLLQQQITNVIGGSY